MNKIGGLYKCQYPDCDIRLDCFFFFFGKMLTFSKESKVDYGPLLFLKTACESSITLITIHLKLISKEDS